jgi:hypothetical protein
MRSLSLLSIKQKRWVWVGWLVLSLATLVLSSCTGLAGPSLPTPLPPDYLPTAIFLTAEVDQPPVATGQPVDILPTSAPPTSTPGTIITASPTATDLFTATPTAPLKRIPIITATPSAGIPNAEIEFLGLGPLSRVTSPIHLSAYIKTWADGSVVVELLGEDRRPLFREIKALRGVPDGAWIPLRMDVDYEISAAAEAGRLQISVEDKNKRITAANTLPLILLSMGEPDLMPAQDILAPIVIQKPGKRALIQGGKVLVSGLLRGTPDQPVLVSLLNTKGVVVGERIANVQFPADGGYGTFQVEVPYTVSQPADALLVVTQGESSLTDVIHLTSLDVMLAP